MRKFSSLLCPTPAGLYCPPGDFYIDPTCPPFDPVPCDVFVSEATFGLPVFVHPPDGEEIAKLLQSVRQFPDRTHLIGAYALGKAQRLIRLLREADALAALEQMLDAGAVR